MKTAKKNNLFFTLLLFGITFNAYSMDKPKPKKKQIALRWVNIAGHIILGDMPLEAFLNLTSGNNNETSFADLSNDVLLHIITLLTSYGGANSLNKATTTIRSLSTVNRHLNNLINDPSFCLQTIKYLAAKFNCSDQNACTELRTHGAKTRLALQTRLFEMCLIDNPLQKEFEGLYEEGTNLEFTYDFWHNNKSNTLTPLMIAAITNNTLMTGYLLKKPMLINNTDTFGTTALMWAAQDKNSNVLQILCNAPTIVLDQQDSRGNTALMYSLLNQKSPNTFDYKPAQILLDAGANPAIKNKRDSSPLKFIKQSNDETLQNILEKTMGKRKEKK